MSSKQVFISYAWGGQSEDVANELETLLDQYQIELIRDKTNLGFKGLIQEFMREIGQGNLIILVISDKYLKSKNCMFELLEVEKKGEFYERIFPIVLPDANIYDSLGMIGYLKFWDQKIKELNEHVKELENLADTRKIQEDINLYTDIRGAFDDLAGKLSNMNTLSLEEMKAKKFLPVLEAIKAKMEDPPADISPKKKDGKVLYHIPNMMQVDSWTRCTVRLAWDEILLEEGLKIDSKERVIESIRLGNIMQVTLMQGDGEENFDIQALNNEEQFIAEDDYTEWLFKVNPRKPGKFSLILRISLIQIIEGKERKKDLVLEREVTAEAMVPEALPKFELAESGLEPPRMIHKDPGFFEKYSEEEGAAYEAPVSRRVSNQGNSTPPHPTSFPPSASPPPFVTAEKQKPTFFKKILPYAASLAGVILIAVFIVPSFQSQSSEELSQAPLEESPTSVGRSPSSIVEEPILISLQIRKENALDNSVGETLIVAMNRADFEELNAQPLEGITIEILKNTEILSQSLDSIQTLDPKEVQDSVRKIRRRISSTQLIRESNLERRLDPDSNIP